MCSLLLGCAPGGSSNPAVVSWVPFCAERCCSSLWRSCRRRKQMSRTCWQRWTWYSLERPLCQPRSSWAGWQMPLAPWGLGGRTGLGEGGFPARVGVPRPSDCENDLGCVMGQTGPQHPERGMMACRKHFSLCPSHPFSIALLPFPSARRRTKLPWAARSISASLKRIWGVWMRGCKSCRARFQARSSTGTRCSSSSVMQWKKR